MDDGTKYHTLKDGRILAYKEYGQAGGHPVFYAHGGPGSRLEGAIFDEKAAEYGFRLIATDRPVAFKEVNDHDISLQFPISLAIIDFDDEAGTGEGIVMYGAELVYNEDKDMLEITNYANQPVLLGDVRKLK